MRFLSDSGEILNCHFTAHTLHILFINVYLIYVKLFYFTCFPVYN